MNQTRYRIFNACPYSIGVHLLNGQSIAIRSGNFQLLSVDDVLYIENSSKVFSKKQLVIKDENNKEVKLEDIGLYEDTSVEKHMTDDEIMAVLKSSVKKIESWIQNIENPVTLYQIGEVAKKMDLPVSKMKVLEGKIPDNEY